MRENDRTGERRGDFGREEESERGRKKKKVRKRKRAREKNVKYRFSGV